MITVRLTTGVRLRSQEHAAGAVLELAERDADELVAAGLATVVKPAPATAATPAPKKEKE